MEIIKKQKILEIVKEIDLVPIIEDGFISYSNGDCVIPQIGELNFNNPPGDVHIKYGYIIGDLYYVIKIASGFFENDKYGIPNGQGMMLVFNQKTGEPVALLLDDAVLNDIRTAVAGQICANKLSNKITNVGIIGTGLQARLQIKYLNKTNNFSNIYVWGRNQTKMEKYKFDMENYGFSVTTCTSASEVLKNCNIIITTTASSNPYISINDILPGTHITAVGSDTPLKRELGEGVIKTADVIVADSIIQCQDRGEISHALKEKQILDKDIIELGNILSNKNIGRSSEEQITIADLTGVAVQDMKIAEAVFQNYLEKKNEI